MEDLPALITALAALGGMVWQGARTRAEIRVMRKESKDQVSQVNDQLQPNHGGSLADAIRRTEALALAAAEDVGELAADIVEVKGDLNGLRSDVRADRAEARAGAHQLTRACNELGALRLAFTQHLGTGE